MPIYEYKCKKCDEKFEMFRSISGSDNDVCCPVCGEKDVERLISAFGVSSSGGGCAPSPYGGST